MKIYTRTGDKGMTSLIGGKRVPKNSLRLEAYGSVDELNAHIGMIRSWPLSERAKEELVGIQHILFELAGNLATDPAAENRPVHPAVREQDVAGLEESMDRLNESLPPLGKFVLPGGDPAVSHCHIARTVCRRTERRILDLNEESPVDECVIQYINRLSDYLFVLSRRLAADNGTEELAWEPRK
ncbi:MAG: cob(I)yrinic acid a,c-diamide adenosyltransferase [Culturomica sp.]|jgi:cob(I)alamin adenosyltransferase|nr:cob(I)yrinic acid a,c-diamide adenosyltransferase [Culturomica sp.]